MVMAHGGAFHSKLPLQALSYFCVCPLPVGGVPDSWRRQDFRRRSGRANDIQDPINNCPDGADSFGCDRRDGAWAAAPTRA